MTSPSRSDAPMMKIAAFYHFVALPEAELEGLAAKLETLGDSAGLRGLIILAKEGINGTVSARTWADVDMYLAAAFGIIGCPLEALIEPRRSEAPAWPFRKFKVRLRDEIVTLGKPEVQPLPPKSETHLSPEDWHRTMCEEDVIVLDTRNTYETRIGKFAGAIAPDIEEFQDFGSYLDRSELPKDKKILIYCTGGIRCEKAIVEMHQHGFDQVYQLDGGILNYLAKYPREKFEGECFVFDNRVAVDQDLKPSTQFKMCPHCGQPAFEALACVRCDDRAFVCDDCRREEAKHTCSKNCAHHWSLSPGKKGKGQGNRWRQADRITDS